MRKAIIAAIALALCAGPALAQRAPKENPRQAEEDAKKRDADQIDAQYRSTLDRTRKDVAPVKSDPWSNMRGDDGKKR
jgi:hypothetical protein